MGKESWSKKEGYNLTCDKRSILAKELKKKGGATTKKLPKISDNQVHALKESHLFYKYDEGAKVKKHRKLKAKIFSGIASLYGNEGIEKMGKRLRKLEGMVYHVLTNRGTFNEEEADKIVDAYMICRERRDPTHHPLQTATVSGNKYKCRSSIQNRTIFSHPIVRRSLGKRGFYLNNGPFSETETLTLMKNFEKFLAVRGKDTDRETIWNLLHDEFLQFYRDTQIFLYIGKGLNRSTFQIYTRLYSLYHPYINGKSDAKTDSYIMERAPALEGMGLHRRYKVIGEEIQRYRYFVHDRYKALAKQKDGFDKETTKKIVAAVGEYRKRNRSVGGVNADADDISLADIAAELGLCEKKLRTYWKTAGRKSVARASLPRWTLKDSLSLFDEIEKEEEEDENCIDFDGIHRRVFGEKVKDWQHLREHYNRVRRRVSYYVTKDLPTVVSVVKKDLKERMAKAGDRGCDDEEGEEEVEVDDGRVDKAENTEKGIKEKERGKEISRREEGSERVEEGKEETDSEEETESEEEMDSDEDC